MKLSKSQALFVIALGNQELSLPLSRSAVRTATGLYELGIVGLVRDEDTTVKSVYMTGYGARVRFAILVQDPPDTLAGAPKAQTIRINPDARPEPWRSCLMRQDIYVLQGINKLGAQFRLSDNVSFAALFNHGLADAYGVPTVVGLLVLNGIGSLDR